MNAPERFEDKKRTPEEMAAFKLGWAAGYQRGFEAAVIATTPPIQPSEFLWNKPV